MTTDSPNHVPFTAILRRRQPAVGELLQAIFSDPWESSKPAVQRRFCRTVMNEILDDLIRAGDSMSLRELQTINKMLIENQKMQSGRRASTKKSSKKSVKTRSGPLPETLTKAIRQLYGGTIKINEPMKPELPSESPT